MFTIYNCIVNAHDLRLVGLAAVICLLASFAAIGQLHHMRRSTGYMRHVWLVVSAISTGFGIWATHFIAMMAFTPGVPSAYNVVLTFLSLVAAIFLTGAGLAAAAMSRAATGAYLGGAMVGGGIAAMHYTGMAAFEIQGRIVWDPALVAVSILLGALLAAAALPVGLRTDSPKARVLGAVLLTLAVCSHHFTAMGAAAIVPDPTIEFSAMALPSGKLAIAVASVSFVIVGLAFAGITIEMRTRAHQFARMRDLANAAVEGLLLCDGQTIVTVNDSFAKISGSSADGLIGLSLEDCFPEQSTRVKLLQNPNEAIEGDLLTADGSMIPVELIMHPIGIGDKPHQAIAVRDLRARKLAEQQIHFLAYHDSQTGVPNRNSFSKKLEEDIESALETGERIAVLFLDLDRFKDVNEVFGVVAGDKLLRCVAQRIQAALDPHQTIARLGGDEFAIIAPGLRNAAAAARIALRVLEVLHVMPQDSEISSLVSSSIGIAIYPQDATGRHELLSCADTALSRAKKDGRGTYCFFEPSMGAEIRDRCQLEHDLRQALERGEFRLIYQPVMDIQTSKFTGFEALLRWKHPARGEISPSKFVPIAEDSAIILPLGEWVLRAVCREAASWAKPLSVAVNVSAVQIHNPSFAKTVHEILIETALAPSRLVVEITEAPLFRDMTRTLETLRRIKMLGVRIALDDFGTGHSSLSHLRAFPFDKVKIDRTFVRAVNADCQQAVIVRSVLGLGRALNLKMVAVDVENQAELGFLEDQACDEVQGFWVGKPNDIESFCELTHPENETERQSTMNLWVPKPVSMRSA